MRPSGAQVLRDLAVLGVHTAALSIVAGWGLRRWAQIRSARAAMAQRRRHRDTARAERERRVFSSPL